MGRILLWLSILRKIFELEGNQLFVKEHFYGSYVLRVFSEKKVFSHLTKFSLFFLRRDAERDRLCELETTGLGTAVN